MHEAGDLLVGVGNCASSFVQGVEYYKDADDRDSNLLVASAVAAGGSIRLSIHGAAHALESSYHRRVSRETTLAAGLGYTWPVSPPVSVAAGASLA
jgi:hypothetical protein